jgi:uncharacterized protein YbbC (DUF1343 family)
VITVRTGLEVLADEPGLLAGRRWALLANQAAVDAGLAAARSILPAAGCGLPRRLFAPEHGLDGTAQDMEPVADRRDHMTGCEVRSLYGCDAASLKPERDDLADLDVLVVDLPDIGSRHYTFAATMDSAMAAAERNGVEILVLDRPNPIGGVQREGGLVQPGFESFVSQLPTPIRHGLTLGEIALLLQRQRYRSLELTVIRCRGWRRHQWLDHTGLPWVPPSPNMPTLETAALYPGLCLIEATTLSEGRGTTRPFHLVGAPWLDAETVVARVRDLGLPGCAVRAARFRPQFGKHAGEVCSGLEFHVTDREALQPVELGLRLIETIARAHPDRFQWRREPYEFVTEVPAIDLLTGSAEFRRLLEEESRLDPLLEGWRRGVSRFEDDLEGVLLYHDAG